MNEQVRVEFIVEPFVLDDPGPHVAAAVQVAREAGLDPDLGPFATTATGDLETVLATIGDLLTAGFSNGATSAQIRIDADKPRLTIRLHDALERMVREVESEMGTPISEMDRAQKQQVVARLDAHGAFLLRGSVEELAALMKVSKVTLYAYINAISPAD